MSDFAKTWDTDLLAGDIKIEGAGFDESPLLDTLIINALFSDARATPEVLARMGLPPDTDPRGWVGDSYAKTKGDRYGSLLWTLEREKQTDETLNLARDYCEAALAFLIEDGIAGSITVAAEWIRRGVLAVAISLGLIDGRRVQRHFDYVLKAA